MIKIKIGEKCGGCGKCANICPTDVLEIIDKKAVPSNLEECMACRACEPECPFKCIRIIEPEWQ